MKSIKKLSNFGEFNMNLVSWLEINYGYISYCRDPGRSL